MDHLTCQHETKQLIYEIICQDGSGLDVVWQGAECASGPARPFFTCSFGWYFCNRFPLLAVT
jgi:hypothetical protein